MTYLKHFSKKVKVLVKITNLFAVFLILFLIPGSSMDTWELQAGNVHLLPNQKSFFSQPPNGTGDEPPNDTRKNGKTKGTFSNFSRSVLSKPVNHFFTHFKI